MPPRIHASLYRPPWWAGTQCLQLMAGFLYYEALEVEAKS